MDSQQLRDHIKHVVGTLDFAWVSMKPEFLHTVHRLAVDSLPATRGIRIPFDTPVHDLVSGTEIRPSEMQNYLLDRVVPSMLTAIQSIAEDELNYHFGNHVSLFSRIEKAFTSGLIDRQLASKAHYWRIARNVLAHGGGIISTRVEKEVKDLFQAKKILFDKFLFWGPLLDAGHTDTPDTVSVPIIEAAVTKPHDPGLQCQPVDIIAGNRIKIGLADILAAGDIWATMILRVCGR